MGMIFAVVVALEIIGALIVFIFIGVSICNSDAYGIAAIISAICILAINGFTLVTGTIYFLGKTRVNTGQVGIARAAPDADVTANSADNSVQQQQQQQQQRPPPPPAKEEEEEAPPAEEVDDGGIE